MAQLSDPTSSVKDVTTQAKKTIDSAAEQAQEAATQVGRQVGAIGGNLTKAVDKSLKDQPITLGMSAFWVSYSARSGKPDLGPFNGCQMTRRARNTFAAEQFSSW